MNKFGNLDNLNLGMGLKMTKSQTIPSKNASFGDWASSLPSKSRLSTGLVVLLSIFMLYNLR